jgi:hypothetical protein
VFSSNGKGPSDVNLMPPLLQDGTKTALTLFRKGFVVDVNVSTIEGRPVAYRVTNVHQVIDLPEDDQEAEPILA